jgi:DNA-binding IclR family transcriptional regulator
VERALDVLEALAASDDSLGVSELTRRLHLDKATVFRILTALARRGYVRQDGPTRKYRFDTGLLVLAAQVLSRMDLPQRARPYLAELVTRTGQSAHLAVPLRGDPLWVVYVGQERSPSRVQVDIGIGEVAPAHCTAVGKVLLAALPAETLRAALAGRRLAQLTARTRTTLPALTRHLHDVRRRGFAVDDEEFHPNIRCLAAPVYAGDGRVVASVGISGIAADISRERIPHLARVLVEVAGRLSQTLGDTATPALEGRRVAGGRRWV